MIYMCVSVLVCIGALRACLARCADNRAAGVRFGAQREPRFYVGRNGDQRSDDQVRMWQR